VIAALDMLEHMSPWEYTALIRPILGHGSGFDSPGFREVRRVSPMLGDAFHRLRRDAGLSLADLYKRGRDHEELYQLAEALTEWDERVTLWRVRHLKVIERIIGGNAVGTQGTPVELLGRLMHKKLYPELWDVRDELTSAANAAE
jgi:tryptophan 2,3-dioxygenase